MAMTKTRMLERLFIPFSVVCIAWGALSCDLTGPEWITNRGYLEFYDRPALVQLPEKVEIGEIVPVVIETYGTGCNSASETLVEYQEPMIVWVTPIDRYPGPGSKGVCPLSLNRFRHVANLSFNGLGEAEILIRGRRLSNEGEEELVLARTVAIAAN